MSLPVFSESVLQVQRECICGKKYWPSQRWVHEGCAVNHQETAINKDVVVNAVANVVVNRSRDRHKKTPERLEYMRRYMANRRSRKPASALTPAGSEDSPPSLKRGPALPI